MFGRKRSLVGRPRPRIAVLHIPKTAGMSLLELVRRNVPEEQTHTFYPPDDTPSPPPEPLPAGVLIGHYPLGFENRYFEDCERVVFLRDPIERLRSQLTFDRRYFGRQPQAAHHAWFQRDEPLSRFIEHSRMWYFDNAMVRMLAGVGEAVPFGELAEEHVARAIENVEAFDFVGRRESFASDAKSLMRRYGWRGRIPRANAAPRREDPRHIPAEDLAPYVEMDQRLCARAPKPPS